MSHLHTKHRRLNQHHRTRSLRRLRVQIAVKDPFSAFSHLLGAFLAVAALSVLVTYAALHGSVRHVVAFAIYGACMVLVYTASTLYHWLPLRPSGEKLFRRLDLTAIYLMIAGSYTPIGVIALPGRVGLGMLALVWLLALLGIALLWWPRQGRRRRSSRNWTTAGIYLGLGWVSALYLPVIAEHLTWEGITWLVAGGIAYSLGAVVYALKRPNPIPRVIGSHEVFHIFVLLGSAAHFFLMLGHILPLA